MDALGKRANQAPFIISKTINDLIPLAHKEIADETNTFDGGATQFTKKAFKYTKSRKGNLFAKVYIQENRPYLTTLQEGGTVKPRKSRFGGTGSAQKLTIPSQAKLNKFGNLTKSYVKIRKQKAESGYDKYFLGTPRGRDTYGLYERHGRNNKLRLLVHWETSSRYQKRIFRADERAADMVRKRGVSTLKRNIALALRTAK